MSIKLVRKRIIIDAFIGNDGQDSNWSIVMEPHPFDDNKAKVGLYWGNKEEPTHTTLIDTSDLITMAKEVL